MIELADAERAIIELITQEKELPAGDIKPDSRFGRDLGFTSFETVILIGNLEEKLNIRIPQTSLRGMATVGDLARIIKAL